MGFAQNMAQCEGVHNIIMGHFRDLPRLIHVHFLIVLRTEIIDSANSTEANTGKDFQSSTSLIIGRMEKQLQLKRFWSTGRNR
ncbi:hypothetical protein RIR_jg29095.t1 [Rhizophagus irregularis DAOM 181602=DAOM 197198]|uniref:Uncharacterized protein n=1 Tax=Rhizophagus irregularis (strain DAOM 181602 / DAOM 197198 / MUCL 43194) TaxID=747089 RepID=U9ULK5_RHIID|nr:hypothetical protein RIR_jg29095.t1 [Rhizophagus irregularis DAOM 181602=DAOM 197198]CAB4481307.1 unnamed protein product [Rhizophagus irregularis]CAG8477622.1 1355_t:CDS:2 [Rhizophagus irregularis]